MRRRLETKADALRRVLAPGRWVPHLRMRDAGGTRFSARLAEMKRRSPWEKRWNARGGFYEYRRATP